MSTSNLTIPKAPDQLILRTFGELKSKFDGQEPRFHIFGLDQPLSLSNSEHAALIKKIEAIGSGQIRRAEIDFPGLNISYNRGVTDDKHASGIFDQLSFNSHNSNGSLTPEQRVEILGHLAKKFKPVDPNRTLSDSSEAQARLEALHNSIIERLAEAHLQQVSRNAEFVQQLERDRADSARKLEEDYRNRQASLDASYEERRRDQDERDQQIQKRLQEVNDRQNTHERRAIRGDLQKEIASRQQRFQLTPGTRNLRWPMHALCTSLLLFLGYSVFHFSSQTIDLIRAAGSTENVVSTVEISYVILRQIVLAAAFGGAAIFYLRWINRWFEAHSSAEFQLKQFQLDVDRASWVVEAAFEWQKQVDQPMPSDLLKSIGRNLFDTGKIPDQVVHPADELASALMGTAAKVRLNAGPAEIEISGKDLKKAKPINASEVAP